MEDLKLVVEAFAGEAEFTFIWIDTKSGVIFFTSVEKSGTFSYFNMEQREGAWKIVKAPKPPDWIFQFEEALAKCIVEGLSASVHSQH